VNRVGEPIKWVTPPTPPGTALAVPGAGIPLPGGIVAVPSPFAPVPELPTQARIPTYSGTQTVNAVPAPFAASYGPADMVAPTGQGTTPLNQRTAELQKRYLEQFVANTGGKVKNPNAGGGGGTAVLAGLGNLDAALLAAQRARAVLRARRRAR
jgi:hypothetical protein